MKLKKLLPTLAAAGMLLTLGAPASQVQAAKVKYKIVKHKQTKYYPYSKISYSCQQPVLQGKSAAVKKINKSLASAYKKNLKFFKKNGYDMAKDVSNLYDTDPDLYHKEAAYQMAEITQAHVYSSKKYVSVGYRRTDAAYQAIHEWAEAATYSLKTGKKVKLTNLIKGNKKTIKKKIYKAQSKDTKSILKFMSYDPSKVEFIVKGNKVYIAYHSVTYFYGGYTFLDPVKIDK
ncbi:hypothetical protein BTI73_00010 [Lactobacillus delbrueckii subsp. bulgaricus]|nr:hypothetical protein [Lactobacillus delbrueckii subsp. bulgaricus]